MKKLLFASVILTIILSACGGTDTGPSQTNGISNPAQRQTIAAPAVSAASEKEYLEYNNNGLRIMLPKNLQSISEETEGTSFIYDTEQSRYFIFAISGVSIDRDYWKDSLQSLNDHFIAEAGLKNVSKLEKETVTPPKGLENISDISITKTIYEFNKNGVTVKNYGYILSSFECGYTWVLGGIYAGKDTDDIPNIVDDIYSSLQYSSP